MESVKTAVWTDELGAIKDEISDIYLRPDGQYDVFYDEMTKPSPNGRTRANPDPMTFYRETPRLHELYARAVTLVCASGTYDDLIEILDWLQKNCPEHGRGLYFSNIILDNRLLAPEHKTKCAYAYIASIIQNARNSRYDDIHFDVIEDTDNGDVGVIHAKLVKRIPELSCAALPILAALRVVLYPIICKHEARNAAAIEDSSWLALARTMISASAEETADEIVSKLISELS